MIALYMRVSDEDANKGDGESNSIQNQRSLLRKFVESRSEFNGERIVEFCDDGHTGRDFQRPGMEQMLSMLGYAVKCIVVKDFSRFGRNLIEVGDYLDQKLPALGVRFISVNDGYDSKSINGSAMSLDMSMKALLHELYSKDLSTKIRQVQQAKFRKGEYLGAFAFFGYKRSETKHNGLEIEETAATTVRRIFSLAYEGKTMTEIACALNTDGVQTPLEYRRATDQADLRGWHRYNSKPMWDIPNLRRILTDRRYTGCLISNKRTAGGISGKKVIFLPEEDWIVVENAFDAIVSKEVFEQAQKIFTKRQRKVVKKNHTLFRSMPVCGYCGKVMYRTKDAKQPYYRCATGSYIPDAECAGLRIAEHDLTVAVLGQLKLYREIVDGAATEEKSGQVLLAEQVASCKVSIEKCKTEQIRIFEDFADGKIDKGAFSSKKAELTEKLSMFMVTLKGLEMSAETPLSESTDVQKGLTECEKSLYNGDVESASLLLSRLVKKIRIFKGNAIQIDWKISDFFQIGQ